jgi:hypothetical protein
VGVGAGAETFSDEAGLFGIDIHHADQFHIRQVGQNAGMVLAQMSDADDSGA